MKKIAILFILLFLTGWSSTAHAQSIHFGLKAGANYSNVYFKNVTRPERLWGFAAGGFAQIALTRDGFFAIQPELLYSAKGAKSTLQLYSYHQRLHYLELPIVAKINAAGLIFEVGPQVSLLMAARNELPSGTSTDLSGYNRLTLGAIAGVGY